MTPEERADKIGLDGLMIEAEAAETLRQDIAAEIRDSIDAATVELREENAELARTRAALAGFKAWVHDRLDADGVPHDPDPKHTADCGCRISGRMQYVFDQRNRLAEAIRKHQAELAACRQQLFETETMKVQGNLSAQHSLVLPMPAGPSLRVEIKTVDGVPVIGELPAPAQEHYEVVKADFLRRKRG